jgi:hypothetical protein
VLSFELLEIRALVSLTFRGEKVGLRVAAGWNDAPSSHIDGEMPESWRPRGSFGLTIQTYRDQGVASGSR